MERESDQKIYDTYDQLRALKKFSKAVADAGMTMDEAQELFLHQKKLMRKWDKEYSKVKTTLPLVFIPTNIPEHRTETLPRIRPISKPVCRSETFVKPLPKPILHHRPDIYSTSLIAGIHDVVLALLLAAGVYIGIPMWHWFLESGTDFINADVDGFPFTRFMIIRVLGFIYLSIMGTFIILSPLVIPYYNGRS